MKNSVKIYFQEMEKMLPMKRYLRYWKNGFHQPENQFSLARMEDLLKNKFAVDGKSFN